MEDNMKNSKKLLSLLLALVMMVGVFAPLTVLADSQQNEGDPEGISTKPDAVTNTVTLHKMLMTKENVKARKVTVNTGTQEKPNMDERVIVQKDGKYYYAADNSELSTTAEPDSKYIAGFASGTPVFPGYSGLDETEYDGKEIKTLSKYFGSDTQMKDVYFAWQVVGKETTTVEVNGENKTVPQYIKKAADSTETLYKPAFDQDGNPELTTNIDEAFGGLTTDTGIKFDTSKLKGKFLIQEVKEKSKYQNEGKSIVDQRAVPVEITLPLVNDEGTVLDAHVYPKNVEDKPKIDKNFIRRHGLEEAIAKGGATNETLNAGAQYENYEKEKAKVTADVGRVIPYEVKTLIAKGTSYEKLIWNDNMTNGLTYNKDLENSKTYKDLLVKDENNQEATKDVVTGIKILKKGSGANGADEEVTLEANDYKIVEDDKGFRLMFTKDGLDKISKITKPADVNGVAQEAYDVEVVLTYTATVNGSTKVDNPEKNNITLEYGHKKGEDIKEKDVSPSNKKIQVNKSFDPELDEEAKKDLVLSYTLKENGKAIATVTLTKDDAVGKVFDLGNGIKFEVTGDFKGTFTGLDDTKTYSFYERVAGYNPEYANTDAAGTVTITNKKDNDNPPPLSPKEPKVVTGGKKFVKTNDKNKGEEGFKRLLGAQFVVKKEVGEKTLYLVSKADATKANDQKALLDAEEAYRKVIDDYNAAIKGKEAAEVDAAIVAAKITVPYFDANDENKRKEKEATNKADIETGIEILRKEYEVAFKTAGTLYDWAEKGTGKAEDIENVVKISSDAQGRFEIQGLAYGEYKLEEIKTPEGFASISDQPFTVAEGSYKGADTELNYKSDTDATDGYGQQVKNKEVTIPQTGGIGTVIFTVVGIALMAGAVFAMKKNRREA